MSRFKIGLLVIACLLVAAVAGGMVGGGAAIALVRTAYNGRTGGDALPQVTVHSEALSESIVLKVHLPHEYGFEPERRFPILWVLDGPAQGGQVAQTSQALSRIGAGQPVIVVEVPASSSGRRVDFTPPGGEPADDGRADRLLEFLEEEAIPALDSAYRTDPQRGLVGYSLGGLFTLYALTEKADLFDGFIAFSPSIWVNDQAIVPVLERWSQGSEPVSSRLFMSLGSLEGNQMLRGYEAVESTLSASTPPGFRWHAEITPNADHFYSPALSFPVAAVWFWDAASR